MKVEKPIVNNLAAILKSNTSSLQLYGTIMTTPGPFEFNLFIVLKFYQL